MARQNINTGVVVNDGTGDTLRVAGTKINETFTELYLKLGNDSNVLSSQISLEDSAIVFEGATPDQFETRLVASNVTSDVTIRLPDSDGIIVTASGNQTISNKTLSGTTLTNPIIDTQLLDKNNDVLIEFPYGGNTNYVHYVTITPASLNNDPTISVDGSQNDINLSLDGKGTGSVLVNKLSLSNVSPGDGQSASQQYGYIKVNPTTSGYDVTVLGGNEVGEIKVISNDNATNNLTCVVLQLAKTGYNGFIIPPQTGVTMVWNGASWVLIGNEHLVTFA